MEFNTDFADCILRGIVLAEVVQHGNEFIVTVDEGGDGRWIKDGEWVTLTRLTSMTMTFGFGDDDTRAAETADCLSRWLDRKTALLFLALPDFTVLQDNLGEYVMMPRFIPAFALNMNDEDDSP